MTVTASRPVSRTTTATKEPHLPGEAGLWVFIIGDLLMFAVFFGIVVVERAQGVSLFAEAQSHLHMEIGIANTIVLLAGSWFVARGMRALYARDARRTWWFAGALGTAAAFAGFKVLEYSLLLQEGHTPAENDFFMYYFVFTGIHLAHLVIGAICLTVALTVARREKLTVRKYRLAEGCGVYWHMVDMLWLVLFPLLYIVR